MNENLFSKVRVSLPLLAGRGLHQCGLSLRGNRHRSKRPAKIWGLLVGCAFLCMAGKVAATPADTAQLDAAISTLKDKVNQLSLDDPQAFTDFKASIANLNGLLTATNETQAVLLTAGIVSGPAGFNVTVPVTIIPGQFQPSAVQADFLLPSGVTFVSATAGPASTEAAKSIQTAVITGGVRLLVFGLNQTTIGQGVVADLTFTIGPNKTIYPIDTVGIVASDGTGNTIPACGTGGLVRGN